MQLVVAYLIQYLTNLSIAKLPKRRIDKFQGNQVFLEHYFQHLLELRLGSNLSKRVGAPSYSYVETAKMYINMSTSDWRLQNHLQKNMYHIILKQYLFNFLNRQLFHRKGSLEVHQKEVYAAYLSSFFTNLRFLLILIVVLMLDILVYAKT